MVNPPKMILDRMPKAQVIDAGSYDRVVVVSLFDDEKVQLRPYGEDGTGKDSGKSALWDVVQLSGRISLMSTFVVGE